MSRQRKNAGIAAGIGWLALAGAALAADGASVAGRVLDGGGQPAPGLTVMMTRKALAPGEANPGAFTATTASDGGYRIVGLPAADYNVCVSDEADRFLNSCTWNDAVPVSLSVGESRTGVDVRVEEAAELSIDVSDPGSLLSAKLGPPAHRVLVGVAGPHMFVPAAQSVDAAGARHFKARVPFDRDVNVSISSPTLLLKDDKGKPFKRGGDVFAVRVPRGQGPKAVSIAVGDVTVGN